MAKVSSSVHIDVPVEKVWEMIGSFNSLADWHPAVEKSELAEGGKVRKLSLAGGGTIVERLQQHDDNNYTYSYAIEDSPLPVANYVSQLKVVRDGEGCKVEWGSEFTPAGASEADAIKTMQGIYQAGFDNLKKMFGV